MPSDLMTLEGISKSYQTPDHIGRLVLDQINLRLQEGEIVALLGKSGCGKSTLLRVMAGLVPPNAGALLYRGQPVREPVRGIAMVFQSFALFPWLTVLGNVELGLEALGIPRGERRRRAEAAVDLIGLGGFEGAYPKELSGGMRQRVGFARALVTEPDLLLLDEPFSALDVLTASTLRGDLIELWLERRIPTKGILIVSHNVEEAVELADRIIVFSSDPGRIRGEIPITLPYPRDAAHPAFRQIVDEVYTLLTTAPQRDDLRRPAKREAIGLGYRLPNASIQRFLGLIEDLLAAPHNGRADIPVLADQEALGMDELLPMIEALELLGFTHTAKGDIEVTGSGRAFAEADMLERKRIFAEHLLHHVPLAAHIRRVLDERPGHRAPEERFLRELEDYMSEEEAATVLETVINWGRFGELFGYDYHSGVLSLEAA